MVSCANMSSVIRSQSFTVQTAAQTFTVKWPPGESGPIFVHIKYLKKHFISVQTWINWIIAVLFIAGLWPLWLHSVFTWGRSAGWWEEWLPWSEKNPLWSERASPTASCLIWSHREWAWIWFDSLTHWNIFHNTASIFYSTYFFKNSPTFLALVHFTLHIQYHLNSRRPHRGSWPQDWKTLP